jgi:exodeoxyribonuclease VII large subunit
MFGYRFVSQRKALFNYLWDYTLNYAMTPVHNAITLFQLQEFIRRVLALNLPDALWVEAEIAELKSSRGHLYLAMVQKEETTDEPMATASAVIWQRSWQAIRRKLGEALSEQIVQEGVQIRMKVRVDFHERYGMKLVVEDIDPTYTYGLLELQRQQILLRLQQEQLLQKNKLHPLPAVVQRIAVISAATGAGYQDFVQHLAQNPYGYAFSCHLFTAAVQGNQAATEISHLLTQLHKRKADFDCTVIIRGGGSRLDLSAFDQYELCRAIAMHPIPVLTGIGHDVDESLADLTAQLALKTPTAVADFLIRRNLDFESVLLQAGQRFQLAAAQQTRQEQLLLEQTGAQLRHKLREALLLWQQNLDMAEKTSAQLLRFRLEKAAAQLHELDMLGVQLHPKTTLERGYTLTLAEGIPLRSAHGPRPGDLLETVFADGKITSIVQSTSLEP